MKLSIYDAEARVLTYCAGFIACLTAIGYGVFIDTNTKRSAKLLCSKLETPALKREVRESTL